MVKKKASVPQRRLWFTSKKYGWGWMPATWEGWVVLGTYVVVLVVNFYRIDRMSHSRNETLLSYIPEAVILTFLLIYICLIKGEKPRWRWNK